jgi:hypothetical protein
LEERGPLYSPGLQINIFRALGVPTPAYAHVPMILGANGQRLSKRHGAVSVLQYRDQGCLLEALLNYLVRLGWSYGDQEIFSREEMIERFDASAINKSAATFDHCNAPHLSAPARIRWARLLKQVFAIDMEHCPQCGGPLTIIAAIVDPLVIAKILTHLGLSARAPPRSPARHFALIQSETDSASGPGSLGGWSHRSIPDQQLATG